MQCSRIKESWVDYLGSTDEVVAPSFADSSIGSDAKGLILEEFYTLELIST